ncbi:MAG: hypothetical protein PHS05_06330 [Bacteroidales bacterium]|nr:hypothetical protein [Bacteroidales bacterium]
MNYKRAILGFVKWMFAIVYVVVALSFVSKREQQVTCTGIDIEISDSLQNAFITKGDVLRVIERQHSNLIGIPIRLINTLEIEQSLREMQAVSSVSAYKASTGRLSIKIEQRKPMVRIINRKGQSYYIDQEGKILSLSNKFTSHVMIINGNISEPYNVSPNITITDWAKEDSDDPIPLICKLFDFAKYISSNKLWAAQISQIYVDDPNNIELIPRVGPHTILIGNLDDYEEKLEKLELFYKKALPEEGWNKYKLINLKYRNQIVCTKR